MRRAVNEVLKKITTKILKSIFVKFLQKLVQGHQIGSHSWSHANLVQNITADEIRAELRQVADLVGSIIGRNMTIFRPPYGAYDDRLLQIARQEFGYEVVNWNIGKKE